MTPSEMFTWRLVAATVTAAPEATWWSSIAL